MPPRMPRRRFLAITAGAAALAGQPAAASTHRWRGVALGAPASITLDHPEAARLVEAARTEIARLEAIFSLHRPDAALVRLNAAGRMAGPPVELVDLLGLCGAIHAATDGAFDPTIQPLWTLHAESWARGGPPGAQALEACRARIGWRHVRVAPGEIAFARRGMALSLNGIAQGYIADRVATLLAAEGLTEALIETGEIRALGGRPAGGPWRVGLPGDGAIGLRSAAIATSAPLGTVFDPAGRVGHILDPRTGRPGGTWGSVSVIAPRAAVADALSTAFCLMDREAIDRVLAGQDGVSLAALT